MRKLKGPLLGLPSIVAHAARKPSSCLPKQFKSAPLSEIRLEVAGAARKIIRIAQVLTEFVPLSKLMAEQIADPRVFGRSH